MVLGEDAGLELVILHATRDDEKGKKSKTLLGSVGLRTRVKNGKRGKGQLIMLNHCPWCGLGAYVTPAPAPAAKKKARGYVFDQAHRAERR